MTQIPETRESLILRLPSAADADAWHEFVSIYEPFVYRFALRGGLQDADARELVQNVLLAVARAIGRWRCDKTVGKFRTWLFRIARNQLIDISGRLKRQITSVGGTSMVGLLEQTPQFDGWDEDEVKLAHRRELFQWAVNRVKGSVKQPTWQAFWLTTIENQSVDSAARTLQLSTGAVYIARSRVFARLREEVRQWEDHDALL